MRQSMAQSEILFEAPLRAAEPGLRPLGGGGIQGTCDVEPGKLPATLDDLTETVVRSYDLSVTTAAELKIPVIGEVGGGFSRRVVVLEHASYKPIVNGDFECQFGYVIRFCLTVNKWSADLKVSLPFLAASAQLGIIEGQWLLQVRGLAGAKIDEAALPPTELNVETFVIAKQALTKLIAAVRDPSTKFKAALIASRGTAATDVERLRSDVGRVFGLSSIRQRRRLVDALDRLSTTSAAMQDAVIDIYQNFGVTKPDEKPSSVIAARAGEVLERVNADT